MIKELYDVITAEFSKVFSDFQIIAVFFIVMFAYGLCYPQPYLGEVLPVVPIAVIDKDGTTTSRKLARDIDATQEVAVALKLPDVPSAKRMLMERRISGFVLLSLHFERDILHGRSAPLAFYGDAGYFLPYSNAQKAITTVAGTLGAGLIATRLAALKFPAPEAAASPAKIVIIPLFNPESGFAAYSVPAVFILIMQQLLLMGIGFLNTKSTVNHLRVKAEPTIEVLGKTVVYVILGLFLFVVAGALVPDFHSVPRIGNFIDAALIATPMIIAVSGLGLTVASFVRDPLKYQWIIPSISMPLFFVSGLPWPRETLLEWFGYASLAIPSTSAISGVVRVNQMNASVADLQSHSIVLWCLAFIYMSLAFLAVMWRHGNEANRATPQKPSENSAS